MFVQKRIGSQHIIFLCFFAVTNNLLAQYIKENDRKEIRALNRILPPKTAIELELVRSFPNENEEAQGHFLPQPDSFARDSRGYFYIPDTKANVIFKFDPAGAFFGQYGHPGQGPGDFLLPMHIDIMDDNICVFDVGNRRAQKLDMMGRFIDSKRISKEYSDLVFLPTGGFLGAPAHVEHNNGNALLDLMDEKGTIIRSFGEPKEFRYDRSAMNSRKILISNSNEIFLVFECLPIVRKYSFDGRLLGEMKIENEFSSKKELINRRMNSYYPDNRPGKLIIFAAASLLDNHIFLVDYVPNRMWIWAYDQDLRHKETYYWENGGDFMNIRFMRSISMAGRKEFLILGSLYQGGEERIHVFTTK